MKRALIVTVGTGTRADVYIVKPLTKTVIDSRPDFTVFVVSAQSRDNALAVASALGLAEGSSFCIHLLDKRDDFERVFKDVNQLFRDLHRQGYAAEEIQLDFTSGTKAMTAGAVLSAVYNRCASLKYITGERKNGVVVDETEHFLSIPPQRILRLYEVRIADRMIRHLRFDAAREILGEIRPQLLAEDEAQELKILTRLANAYLSWDLFDHESALKCLEKIPQNSGCCPAYLPTPEMAAHLRQLSGKVTESSPAFLCDLFNNARRRKHEGKYDDAVARLYRGVEFCAQSRLLANYGMQTGDVDLERVPPGPFRETLQQFHDPGEGKCKIGLFRAYELLSVYNDVLGCSFMENTTLQGRIKERNLSILAHGLKPVSAALCNRLLADAAQLFELMWPGFMQYADAVQFPWLSKEGMDAPH